MATQRPTEKQDNAGKQQALTRQGEQQQVARTTPTARRITRSSPMSAMRRMLDELDVGTFGWGPTSMMRRMLDDMERIFETDFFEDTDRRVRDEWAPRVDVRRRDDQIMILVDLPGMSSDQIEISVQDNMLVIEGERARSGEEGELWRSERSHGRFRRVVVLPEDVDPEQVTARFENGVLEIAVMLPASQITRRIQIGDGEQREQAASQMTPQQTNQPEQQTASQTTPQQTNQPGPQPVETR